MEVPETLKTYILVHLGGGGGGGGGPGTDLAENLTKFTTGRHPPQGPTPFLLCTILAEKVAPSTCLLVGNFISCLINKLIQP